MSFPKKRLSKDSADLGLLLNNFNKTDGYVYRVADLNEDGIVVRVTL